MMICKLVVVALLSSSCMSWNASAFLCSARRPQRRERGTLKTSSFALASSAVQETIVLAQEEDPAVEEDLTLSVQEHHEDGNSNREKNNLEIVAPPVHDEAAKTTSVQDEQKELVAQSSVEGSSREEKNGMKENKEITHLQKKLRYWKREQKDKEDSYKRYLRQHMMEHNLKPIYVREGKIDTYKLRPVFDKETERIQTEIWSIKEHIKLAHAKMAEERRVEQVRQETAHKLSQHDADVRRLLQQQEQIRKTADERLREKEREIDSLAKEIQNLAEAKNSAVSELQTKETILETLRRERASLRSLVRQSWKVLTTRFRQRVLRQEEGEATEEDEEDANKEQQFENVDVTAKV